MAIAFRARTAKAFAATIDTAISKPSGVVDGDTLIASIVSHVTNTTISAPIGWTEYSGSPFAYSVEGGLTQYSHHYWKIASGESSTWTWSHDLTTTAGQCLSYSGGVVRGDPNDCTPSQNEGGPDTNCVGLSITTVNPNSLAVMISTYFTSDGGRTPPDGYVEHGNPNVDYSACDKLIQPAGATGNQTLVFINSINWFSFFIALKSRHDVMGNVGRITAGNGISVSDNFRG